MRLGGAGLLAGLAGALLVGGVIRSQLYNVQLFDPITLAGVVLVRGASALLASFLPARRAAATDPGVALRDG
jgi:hypothetical protein